jgi:hypothetical protein
LGILFWIFHPEVGTISIFLSFLIEFAYREWKPNYCSLIFHS